MINKEYICAIICFIEQVVPAGCKSFDVVFMLSAALLSVSMCISLCFVFLYCVVIEKLVCG